METKQLDIFGVIAFDGLTRNGLWLHPDGEHLVYATGNKVTIKNMRTEEQIFLTGHKTLVSTLCISPRGDLIASGQVTHHGFKATVIIWDYEKRKMKANHETHKVRVENVCFTQDGRYLISLGGRDDGYIVVWDVQNETPLCGTFAGKETFGGHAETMARTNVRNASFVTAGDGTIRLWRVDPKGRKLHGIDIKIGKIRRVINCVVLDEKDENVYCGTTSGDVIKARLNIAESGDFVKCPIMIGCYSKIPRAGKATTSEGEVYAGGVRNLLLSRKEEIIIGAGDGTVELVEIVKDLVSVRSRTKKLLVVPCIKTYRTGNVCATVTSMIRYKDDFILVGTVLCEIYEIQLSNFRTRPLVTCHTSSIYDLAFPRNRSEIFATAGKHDIRVWKLTTQKELLRITVPNFICSSLSFDRDGGTITSGKHLTSVFKSRTCVFKLSYVSEEAWNDGTIRGFSLNGGKLLFAIHRAHAKSVTAITITNDDSKLVSGGCDGQVRIWNAKSASRQLLDVLKQHRGPITSLHVSPDDKNLISSSTDGTCIVWDIRNLTRKFALRGNTMYMATTFVPSGIQVLTCGTDRKIAYWEVLDGSLVREVEGSTTGTLNAISVSRDGQYFLTGSDDFTARLWDYRAASTVRLGLAHAAPITSCAFAPNGQFMVTVSADGAIIIWEYPFDTCIANDNGLELPSTICASRPRIKDQVVDKNLNLNVLDNSSTLANVKSPSHDSYTITPTHFKTMSMDVPKEKTRIEEHRSQLRKRQTSNQRK